VEEVALVVSGLAAAAAVAAALFSKSSADAAARSADAAEKSAQAEERAAAASEAALAIETQRAAAERAERAEREAPVLDGGAHGPRMWVLRNGQLEGTILNLGPTSAFIQHIRLEAGGRNQDGAWPADQASLFEPDSLLPVSFAWDGDERGSPVRVLVAFGSPMDYRATASFRLLRNASDAAGNPQWRCDDPPRVIVAGY
jgi:hypothetical protein